MAQMVVPPMQCQMGVPRSSAHAKSIMTSKMWGSLLLSHQTPKAGKGLARLKVLAVQSSSNGTVSRLHDVLNLDLKPHTDEIIAEYIWIGGTGIDIRSKARGVANRGCSIRVGRETEREGKGYLEDRRPASNMDPYVVTSLLAETTILWEPSIESEALAAKKLQLQV